MNHKILLILLMPLVILVFTSETMNDDGRAGYVGSPGEVTCNTTNCHNSFALNSGGGSLTATCNMNNWKYQPLTTYTITIKVAKAGVGLFGFAAEILNSSNNNAGTIIVSDAVHTIIKSRIVGSVSRRNIVHKLNGGLSQDSMSFSFNWTSPDTTSGAITMYFAGNATNSSGSQSGDYIYTSTQLITPESGSKIDKIVTVDAFSVHPNPAVNNISIHYFLQKDENVDVKLYDLNGKFIFALAHLTGHVGENNDVIFLPSECSSGLYILGLESSSGQSFSKLMIN